MKRRLPYFCLFCVFERFTVTLYGVFGNGDAAKRLSLQHEFWPHPVCPTTYSHAQNCIFHIFWVMRIAGSAQSSFQKLSGPCTS